MAELNNFIMAGGNEIGDIVTSLLSVNRAGHALLPLDGRVVNPALYPKLVAAIGPRLNVNEVTSVESGGMPDSFSTQTLDARYIYSASRLTLKRLDVSTGNIANLVTLKTGYSARVKVSPDGKTIVFHSAGIGNTSSGDVDVAGEVVVSRDYGVTFTAPYSYQVDKAFSITNAVIIKDQGKIWFASDSSVYGDRVFYSSNAGASWVAVIVRSHLKANRLTYVEDNGSRLYGESRFSNTLVSTDNGANWGYLSIPSVGNVYKFAIDNKRSNFRVSCHSETDEWYYSNNHNVNWNRLSLPVSKDSVHQLIISDAQVFVITKIAEMYHTNDLGLSWNFLGWLNPESTDRTKTSLATMPDNFNSLGINNYVLRLSTPSTVDGYMRAKIDVSAKLPAVKDPNINKVIADKVAN